MLPVGSKRSRSPSPSPTAEGEYEVEEVVDFYRNRYCIKWKGYESSENTWEPIEHLEDCKGKLLEFYHKRKLQALEEEALSSSSGRKRPKVEVPPDPRSLQDLVDAFYEKIGKTPSFEELNAVSIALLKGDVRASERWVEAKVKKSLNEMLEKGLTDDEVAALEKHARFCMVETRLKLVRQELNEWEASMNRTTKGAPIIHVENTVNLAGPPANFTYINDYLPRDGIIIPDDPPVGCECEEDCAGIKVRNKGKKGDKCCCPAQNSPIHSAFYTKNKRICVPVGTPIYECNKKCKCSDKCTNRVVQDGVLPLKQMKLTIFQTNNGRGWGVKTMKSIKKGTFLCMYVGEIITNEEGNRRGQTYDANGCTYLFDLDMNETDTAPCVYTVDAAFFGNVSHFINHSCEPNSAVYNVWSNCLDPNLPKLALFAIQDIQKDTELTFDYTNIRNRGEGNEENVRDNANLPLIKTKQCACGAVGCRKFMF